MAPSDESESEFLTDFSSFNDESLAADESSRGFDFDDRLRRRAAAFFWTKKTEAETIVEDSSAISRALERAKNWTDRFARKLNPKAFEGLATIFRMVKATQLGQYKGVDKSTLAMLVAALLYCVSPIDVIPDAIPVVGLLDDLFVLTWTLKKLAGELRCFREWERLSAAKSALAAYLPYFNQIKRVVLCPGWMTENDSCEEVSEIFQSVFTDATLEIFHWQANVSWPDARDYADGAGAVELVEFLRGSSDDLSDVALFGHSLGARMTARALAKLTREPEKKALFSRKTTNRVAQAYLMGAAIDADDPDLPAASRGVLAPLCNFFSRSDRVLSYLYRAVEQKSPLGLSGVEIPCENYVDCVASGHEEYFLSVVENVADFANLLNFKKSVLSRFSMMETVASGLPSYLKHQFAFYADFFRNSIQMKTSDAAE